ncbi:DNA repair protein RecO [Thalassotalea profundi]|uniref:DNA repair protein RecO n=1 Tax=Thalassotalea profundi TaxID=2036687 RepID=A0ABQ3ILT2_9GAMM|nr:DNA repair protein RecO [Thalassotalea profundi]GHE86209.1 DNA repair protein RecO [Thalassotalea profundi]
MYGQDQAAFILHSRPYRENQHLVELLTQQNGKVSALAYVSHTTKSSKKSLLQPFLPVNVVLSGNSSLQKLVRVEALGKSYSLEKERLYSAFYLNELLVRLLPEDQECPLLFSLYQESLIALIKEEPVELILRAFEVQLLEELGQGVDFSMLEAMSAEHIYYVPDSGFQLENETNKHMPKYAWLDMHAIACGQLSSITVRQSYKKLMRQIINHLLGGKPLNSRKLFS